MILAVCPLSRLDEHLAAHRPSHLVSLLSPAAEPPPVEDVERLHLAFHDIAEPRADLIAPSADTIAALLAFAEGWTGERPLLLHCYAGVSRSTAAAFILACARRPDRDEAELAKTLRRLSPSATPNRLMVALADAALDRDGRMSAAIEAIGRGADCFEGEAFAWDLAESLISR
ncbi:hypothetical protein DMC25_05825 [Caulobacter sp. D4A]|uniref:tyrosine phosphatase family protein n=1 Tax=unclassified Caulobacter TaxID=2648921 RepID=UPI000D73D4FA|nr:MULTISPECIES: hypothetical protein [unclassified Caulobacter]PXA91691.1 hypothetical protein DMC25_05825 [Caulobacter sp. D4A]PXA92874.1 hypothetical protein DMC18_10105 [Caulobacter sp. D5]